MLVILYTEEGMLDNGLSMLESKNTDVLPIDITDLTINQEDKLNKLFTYIDNLEFIKIYIYTTCDKLESDLISYLKDKLDISLVYAVTKD